MEVKKNNEKISIEFLNEEYIIFFDWLTRFNENNIEQNFEDKSEQKILWDIEALLEKEIDEIFENNYNEILQKARKKVNE